MDRKLTNNGIIQGAGKLGQNDVTWAQANSTSRGPTKKVNKAK
jgi:hypothetical protein